MALLWVRALAGLPAPLFEGLPSLSRFRSLAARTAAQAAGVRRRALVLPASVPGSLGDAAMVHGLLTLLREHGIDDVRLIDYGPGVCWSDHFALPAVGELPRRPGRYRRIAPAMRQAAFLYVNGADVLDGAYSLDRSLQRLLLAEFAARCGREVTITGFSMRASPPPAIARMFRRLPPSIRLCARDPLSCRRLETMIERPVQQVADLAFLMSPALSTVAEIRFDAELTLWRSRGRRLIGLCPNLHAAPGELPDDAAKAEWIVDFNLRLIAQLRQRFPDVLPVLLPHDVRGHWHDARLCVAIAQRCALLGQQTVQAPDAVSAPAVKQLCARLETVVSGRMHCGIAALGVGTPPVLFDYQGKVRGLLDLFGLDHAVAVHVDPAATLARCVALTCDVLDHQRQRRQQITQALPAVLALARGNCTPGPPPA